MTTRRQFLKTALITTATLPFESSLLADPAEPARPNILFIMSDDHAAHAIGAYNGRLAKLNPTPTIDRLAKEGILFENAYCTNSICTPSRACIMTGQYSHINGVHDLKDKLDPAKHTLAIEMRKAGYQTAMIGKWHLKTEPNFDYYKVLPGQGKYFNPTFYESTSDKPFKKNAVQMKGHSSDCITDSTLNWFKTKRDKTKPFFLMHHYKAPHDMFQNAPRYEDYLKTVDIPEPESMWSQPKFGSIATRGYNDELLPHIGTSIGKRNPRRNYTKNWAKGIADPKTAKHQAYQTYLKKYLRCVKGVDDNLKRLFAYLKAEGLMDNTVILYTGDQGFMLGEHDYQDKRWMYEESHRMPFIVRYPKTIKAGTRTTALAENIDFPATMLDFAGVEIPTSMQGRSLRTICETAKAPADWKDAVYYRYWMHMAHHDNPGHFGLRTKDYKLIFYYGLAQQPGQGGVYAQTPPAWELYDMKNDPKEMVNIYGDPKYAVVIKSLKAKLAQMRNDNGSTKCEPPHIQAVIDAHWQTTPESLEKAKAISRKYIQERANYKPNPKKSKEQREKERKAKAAHTKARGAKTKARADKK